MLNWNEMNENEIIEMAKTGNDEAKMVIVNRYKPLIYKFLSQYYSRFSGTSSELREDIISDGILTILDSINTYDSSKASFSTHVFYQLRANIQNNLRYTYKGIKNGVTSLDKEINEDGEKSMDMYSVIPDNNVDIEGDYIKNEERNHVFEIINRVCTKREKEVLNAMCMDLTRAEIAQMLNCTESSLCGARNRAFAKIRKNL